MISFIKNIALRATKPTHYRILKDKTLAQGVGYIFFVLVLITFVTTLTFALQVNKYLPDIKVMMEAAADKVVDIYPSDLVLTFKDGELSSNQANPYFIDLPASWRSAMQASEKDTKQRLKDVEHLVAIDTNGSSENFASYKSVVLLTKTAFVMPDRDDSALKVMPFSSMKEDLVINHAKYQEWMTSLRPLLDYVAPAFRGFLVLAVILWPWMYAGFAALGYLILALICAVIIWIVAKICIGNFEYSEILTLTMYGLTLPLIVQFAAEMVQITLPSGAFSLILIIWMLLVARSVRA